MEKKEMWKVLGRDDYAHKSQELKKKCEELAKAICDKLIELDRTEITIPRCGITFRVVTVQTSCVKRILLARKSGTIYYLLQEFGICDIRADDLNVKVGRIVDALGFVTHLDEILQEISKIENKEVADIEAALKRL
jgi:hypothetical protein